MLFIIILFMIYLTGSHFVCSDNVQVSLKNGWNSTYYWLSLSTDIPQFIRLQGFEVENHTITTDDGYQIQVFRIVNMYRNTNKQGYPIVMFQGLTIDSESFLIGTDSKFSSETGQYYEFENYFHTKFQLPPCLPRVRPTSSGRNLAFTLAACGYDVWLSNVRDCRAYSSHLVFDPDKDKQYWNINLDHYSLDAKAIFEYVLNVSNSSTVGAVCHSIGCNTLLQLMADNSKFNNLIKPVFLLAPFVYIRYIGSVLIKFVTDLEPALRNILASSPDFRPILPFVSNLIQTNRLFRLVSIITLASLTGLNLEELNVEHLYRMTAHFPSTVAARVLAHVGQRRMFDELYKYDYGAKQNMIEYGQTEPPMYELDRITNRFMALWHGSFDLLVDTEDIERLKSELTVPLYADYATNYSHSDFLFANHVNQTVNLPILTILHELGFNFN